MRSGWFWGTWRWAEYEAYYYNGGPVRTYKSSPLSSDHELDDPDGMFVYENRKSRVLDLGVDGFRGARKSYRNLINRGIKAYRIEPCGDIGVLHALHVCSAGRETRHQATWDLMGEWIKDRVGMQIVAFDQSRSPVAAAYFIMYDQASYYAVAAKAIGDAMHAVVYQASRRLYDMGVRRLEMGDVGYTTPKEYGIALFKMGFGGVDCPYVLATRKEVSLCTDGQ